MRTYALSLSMALAVMVPPALAEPPDIENTGHITGCLKDGKMLSFEISGWGAYRPCWKHGKDAEWITLPRAIQNSRTFTVEARGEGMASGGFLVDDSIELTEILDVGSFRIYSSANYCLIAVGPADSNVAIGLHKEGLTNFDFYGIEQPYAVGGSGGIDTPAGSWREGQPEEVLHSDLDELLIPRFVHDATYAHTGQCREAITFEYIATALAHTVYNHDIDTDEITVKYRRED